MNNKNRAAAAAAAGLRTYQDISPVFDWVRDEGADTLIVELPGFLKEQIKVQIDNYGNLRITGERSVADGRWSRFRKEFQLPENCNINEIRAKFEKGVLYVILPKLIAPAKPEPPKPQPIQDPFPSSKAEPTPEPKFSDEPEKHSEKITDQANQKAESTEPVGAEAEKARKAADGEEKESLFRDRYEKRKFGVGPIAKKIKKPRSLAVNVIVAAVVLVLLLGMYVSYKFRKSEELGSPDF